MNKQNIDSSEKAAEPKIGYPETLINAIRQKYLPNSVFFALLPESIDPLGLELAIDLLPELQKSIIEQHYKKRTNYDRYQYQP